MKKLLFTINLLLLLCVTSCIEDGFTTSSSDVLEFSSDTISFDTVFTDETTAQKRFLIYNRHKKQLNIESMTITSRYEGAKFIFNVDGRSGEEFHNIELRGEDSIYVFVKVHIDANEKNPPFDVYGDLSCITNGVKQNVVLFAAGQNAATLRDMHITKDTEFDTQRPYRIMDSLVVEKGATLTIPAGVSLYFHDKAKMKVEGTLKALGSKDKFIHLRADRLDKVVGGIPFELMASQWNGVFIGKDSYDNEMQYVNMRGTSSGVVVDSCGNLEQRKLHLFNSILHNSSSSVLNAKHVWIDAEGCEFSDSHFGVVDLTGGIFNFKNCTFANYYLFDAITHPILYINYVLPDDKKEAPLMSARFDNSIIYGNASSISIGDLTGSDVLVRYCLMREKGEDDNNFQNCIWGADPHYYTIREEYIFDYRVKDKSDARGKGSKELTPENARFDMFGLDRMANDSIDIGAYVWTPEPKEEEEKK